MVESTVVGVETVYLHGQIPCLTLTVVRTLRVDYPVIAWRADIHLTGCGHEVGRELAVEYTVRIFWVIQTHGQVVVVELLTWVKLYLLGKYHYLIVIVTTGVQCDIRTCRSNRVTIYKDLGTIGIAAGQQEVVEYQRSSLRIVALIGHVQRKASRLVERYIAYYRLVNPNLRLVGRNGCHINYRTRLIPLGGVFLLVRLAGNAATGAIDEARLDGFAIA